ncbi:MAG: alpha/beta hydrolase [Eubacteriales bacterium]|nr:alpha/beta hydrolase [Eubacteriales bacterium]
MKRLVSILTVCLLLVACFVPTSAFAKAKQMNDDVPVWTEETIRQYAEDYVSGKYMSRLWGYYDLQIQRYMPLSAFETYLTNLEWMTGAFLGLGSYSSFMEPDLKLKTHILHLCMEKQDLDMYLTHKDKEDDWEIMALQFVPSDRQELPQDGEAVQVDKENQNANYVESSITVGTAATPLSGILTMPQNSEGLVPACVLVHDQGPMDMNATIGSTALFADLAHALANMGVATIRYDKRTLTYGENADMTVWEEVIEDAISAGQLLAEDERIDKGRIVVIGLGFGAQLAPRIVSQSDKLFTAMIMIGGNPTPYAEQLLSSEATSLQDPENLQALKETVETLPKLSEANAKELTLFGRSGYYYWEMNQYDSIQLLKKMKVKAYIVQGNRDPLVSEDNGWRAYSEAIGDGVTWVSFKAYRGLNHILTNDLSTDDLGQPQYTVTSSLDASAARDLSLWVLSLYQTDIE